MPQGVARQQLELLGPILAHVIRPLVWVRGLWSIELEKVVFVFLYLKPHYLHSTKQLS